ncbi:pleckstrin homology domain-containing family D member 1-like [Pecten maximus]|uniref:pleckstrin homology domain-containing family D member 1-like n=1 Tax=Pecten maximus TaxID=6579 RepID=UPI0014588268|nr:pleckstrin homology domain-containing family D member 1-like [Pecten maximus]
MDCLGSVCCVSHSRQHYSYEAPEMNSMPERNSRSGEWASKVQLAGILYKRPFNHQSNKWAKRYFIIRDGFLCYYQESEKKEMEKRCCINIHPKGIIPLGECSITPSREQGQPFAFYLDSADIHGRMLLAADSSFERDKWIDMLEKSKRITWKHSQLADNLIRQLEDQGLQMAKQKQDYFDQLQSEVLALSDQREKTEELERINQELEKEKQKLESYQQEMTEEYERIRTELEDTAECMRILDSDRVALSDTLQQQQYSLQSLSEEKERILETLYDQQSSQQKLTEENQSLALTKEELQSTLKLIEFQTKELLQEKSQAEEKMKENEQRARALEEEKQFISGHAEELKESLKDLKVQKEMTEAELKEEVMARLDAERKLKDADNSLQKLSCAVVSQTPHIEQEVKEQMVVNVNKLKRFFEDLANEAQIDSDKPLIVKNTIHARKTLARRAKTKKFQRNKSSSLRIKSANSHSDTHGAEGVNLRRTTTCVPRKGISVNFPLSTSSTFSEDL